MTAPDTEQIGQVVRQLWQSKTSTLKSFYPLRLVGYGLLLLACFDLAEILIPPLPLNPQWEFNAFGQIIERAPVMLIGFCFVFVGGHENRLHWEIWLLRVISWLALAAAILHFLMLPLMIANTVRLDRQNQQRLTSQVEGLQIQAEQVQEQLATISTEEEMIALLRTLSGQNLQVPQGGNIDLSELKDEVSNTIEDQTASLLAQARSSRTSRRQGLLKKSIKWNLGTLVIGSLYFLIWRSTIWARRKPKF